MSFFEEGDAIIDGDPGDLIFTVTEVADPFRTQWTRKAGTLLGLVYEHWITLEDALLGFEHQINHLDGHIVTLTHPGVVQYGDVQVVKGEGMPAHGSKSSGDLDIVIKIKMPGEITAKQKKDIRAIFS